MEIYADPVSGRYYTVDPATGVARWVDEPQAPSRADGTDVTPQEEARDRGMPAAAARTATSGSRRASMQPSPRSGAGRALKIAGAGLAVIAVVAVAGSLLRNSGDADARLSDAGAASSVPSPKAAAPSVTPTASASKPVATKAAATKAPVTGKVGAPVRAGALEFTVTGIKTATTIGNGFLSTTSEQGQFLLVSITVKNVGSSGQLFLAASQKLFDTHGQQYAADSAAADYLGEDAKGIVEEIAPGNAVKGTIVFDIPAGIILDRIELHDNITADGVDVKFNR